MEQRLSLGQYISARRKHMRLTQEELADKVGVSKSAIAKWETNGGLPDRDNLRRISEVMAVSVDDLYRIIEREEISIDGNITINLDETTYLVLVKRYKELFSSGPGTVEEVPYDIDGYITTIDTDKIDSDYMNSRFEKYLKILHAEGSDEEELKRAEEELHKTFATLSQEEQKYANIFLHDIQSGDIVVVSGKTFKEYVIEYCSKAKDDQIHRLAFYALCLNESMLRNMMAQHITEDNINEFGRFDALKATVDKDRARVYFEKITGKKLPAPKVNVRVDKLLRDFIISGGFDIEVFD